jgi:hypothetical protein
MPTLREQVATWGETVTDLTVSADDRYRDGQELVAAGRFRGAVYSLGLAAEMWLKLACYRLYAARAADAVGPYARRVANFMQLNAPRTDRESGHSLHYWAEFIILFCARKGRLLSNEQAGRLRHHAVNRLYADWKIELRYRPAAVTADHARRVLADSAWLRLQWERLGR